MRTLTLSYDRVIISKELPAWKVRELYTWTQCPMTLSEYLPDNHMTLVLGTKFVATINIEESG